MPSSSWVSALVVTLLASLVTGCADSHGSRNRILPADAGPQVGEDAGPDSAVGTPGDGGRDATVDADAGVSTDAAVLEACELRPVAACEWNDAGMLIDVELPEDNWSVLHWVDGGLVFEPHSAEHHDCTIPGDGCAEIWIAFDDQGCVDFVSETHYSDGNPNQGQPSPAPGYLTELKPCHEQAWSQKRFPCLANQTAWHRRGCFE